MRRLKHEEAPEEWTKIMAHNIRVYLRLRGYPERRIGYLMDDLVSEGWVYTLKAMTYNGFERDHEQAESYLLKAVMNYVREWSQVNGPSGDAPEPQYGRTSAGMRIREAQARGEKDHPLIRNNGWRSVHPSGSLDEPIRGAEQGDGEATRGAFVPCDQSDRLLEVECRLDLLRCATGGDRGYAGVTVDAKRTRNAGMLEMRLNQHTYPEIAERFGISHERVRQVIKRDAARYLDSCNQEGDAN